ncbi:MAG: M48 family metallopeptidase [Candidatus Omnitrophota bacterium]|nr:M48 family metallopeptidase [Candidatus Omnitrophota bacterium]
MHNYYLPAILAILIGGYFVNLIIERLNIAHASPVLPREFDGYYDNERYSRSQAYLKENVRFGFIEHGLFTLAIIVFILTGGFNIIDGVARSLRQGPVVTGLIFFGIIYFLSYLGSMPFSAYRTFVIEEKYGFNKTTAKTFIADIIKGFVLAALLGSIMISAILWLFDISGRWAWVYSWIAVTAFQLFIVFIAPVTIMPLFNKFTPLAEGELKSSIIAYAGAQNFRIKGIYTMDASRRSAKSNAFFTGFGRYKRIVLFDTLIKSMKTDELVAVLAHEIGHYKHRDMFKAIAFSVAGTGVMLFIMSLFIYNKEFLTALKMDSYSIYAGLFFFTFLYAPVKWLFSVAANYISRRYERSADKFSVVTYKHPEAMISALKRLSVDNLTNLTPHPLKVFLSYSHPPILVRIAAIRTI